MVSAVAFALFTFNACGDDSGSSSGPGDNGGDFAESSDSRDDEDYSSDSEDDDYSSDSKKGHSSSSSRVIASSSSSHVIASSAGAKQSSGSSDKSGNGTDKYGFSVLPAGKRDYTGFFNNEGRFAFLWTTSDVASYYAWSQRFSFEKVNSYQSYLDEYYGHSLRCLKD